MKFHLKMPGGAELHFEREPVTKYKLEMVCWTIGAVELTLGFFSIFIFG